ncbi:MAG: hypothetical protein IBX62_00790 [Coriobacteriia bacterium]|nr:hypothetical protein [Coriobacteriia bacterium]
MAECAFHRGVETGLRCAECERPICPKDMVSTPVGYKCRECARPARGQTALVKPHQLALAAAYALPAGLVGGLVLGLIGFGFFFIHLLFGMGVAEAARRGSGGHRSPSIAAVAGVAALAGSLLGGFGPIGWLLAPLAAVVYVLGNRW